LSLPFYEMPLKTMFADEGRSLAAQAAGLAARV
jgi:hypothetical protein